jgi:Glycosyl transferase family 2
MFCTTIIPTVGRDTLAQTVHSALAQNLPLDYHEIVVVNNSGAPLPPADWQSHPQVRILDINKVPLDMSHNAGAVVAKGEWIKYLHDDDYLTPNGLRALLNVAGKTNCDWVYGAARRVDWNCRPISDAPAEVKGNIHFLALDGESLHLSQSLIRRSAFLDVSGFVDLNPSGDLDLLTRITAKSCVDCTEQLVVCIRVDLSMSTGRWEHMQRSQHISRESALSEPGALIRVAAGPHHVQLVGSGVGSMAYMIGRATRAYAKSVKGNLRHGHIGTAIRRGTSALIIGLAAIASPDFWRGLAGRLPKSAVGRHVPVAESDAAVSAHAAAPRRAATRE